MIAPLGLVIPIGVVVMRLFRTFASANSTKMCDAVGDCNGVRLGRNVGGGTYMSGG
jgi:hypothetical protein